MTKNCPFTAEPATITERPLEEQKAAEGKDILIRCAVFGSPKPLVVWKKGSEQLTGGRYRVTEEGHLEIKVRFFFKICFRRGFFFIQCRKIRYIYLLRGKLASKEKMYRFSPVVF